MAVLSAPGAGIWGGDRDRLCALLRRETPADWAAVRALLTHFATPPAKPPAAGDEVADPDPADVARQAQVLETCRRVEELVALWSSKGPFRTLQPAQRFGALKGVVQATLARFMNPVRFADAIVDLRTQTLWIEAASRASPTPRGARAVGAPRAPRSPRRRPRRGSRTWPRCSAR